MSWRPSVLLHLHHRSDKETSSHLLWNLAPIRAPMYNNLLLNNFMAALHYWLTHDSHYSLIYIMSIPSTVQGSRTQGMLLDTPLHLCFAHMPNELDGPGWFFHAGFVLRCPMQTACPPHASHIHEGTSDTRAHCVHFAHASPCNDSRLMKHAPELLWFFESWLHHSDVCSFGPKQSLGTVWGSWPCNQYRRSIAQHPCPS